MNIKIKAVVFDVGGVLCDWQTICREFAGEIAIYYEKILEVFLKYSFNPKTGSDLGQMTITEFFEKITAALGIPEKSQDWRKRYVPGFRRIELTFTLLNELKGRYRLAAITNSKLGLWDEWERGRFKKYFETIVDSSEVQILKPDERIFQILLDRLQLKPEECLFIDDEIKYVVVAKKLGFKTVHFINPKASIAEIKKILEIR